jgi:hypothetical protein
MDEIGVIYDKAGLERPEVQIKALYKDISYMMQRSGKFTDAQVHDMRFRDSVRLGVMQEGVKKTKNSGDVKMGAVDSLIGEISSVTKKMETMHFHKVLTNLIRGFAVSNNIEGQSVIRHLTPEEVGRLTSGKGPMNEQIADFNASSSDQWIYQYMSEGKVYHTLVSDKNVYSSLVAYDERMNPSTFLAANAFTMALQSAAKLKRALIIRWPGFIAKNFTQDTMLALLSGYSNLPQVAEAMKGAFTNNEKYEKMKRQMMMFGAYEVRQDDVSTDLIKQQEGKIRRKINEKASGLGVAKAKSAIDVYMGLLEKTEGVNRVAIVSTHLANNADFIYAKGITAEESRKRYESILAEANFRARDFLNFAQRGSEAWFNRTLQYTPFARVALTGMEKTLRYTQELSSNPELRKKALVRMSAMGMLAIFYAMNNAGDPDYENAEPYEKLNNWILNMGESSIKIPKPFGLPSLVANSIEGMMGWLISQDPKMAKAVGKDLLEGMVPNVIGVRDVAIVIANSFGIKNLKPSMSVTPELISPLIQMAQNQDYFRGGEIASSYINRKHDLNKFDDYNSKTAIYLSKLTGVAANYFDFYSQATFGSETMKVVRAMSESGPTGAFAPMFKRFVTDNVDLRRGAMTQFYQNRDEYVKAASAVKDLRESEEFIKAPSEEKVRLMAQFTKEDPNFFVKAEMYKAQNKWLKAQNKLLSQIKDYDTMPLPEKKKIKDPLVRKVIEFNRQIEALNASR